MRARTPRCDDTGARRALYVRGLFELSPRRRGAGRAREVPAGRGSSRHPSLRARGLLEFTGLGGPLFLETILRETGRLRRRLWRLRCLHARGRRGRTSGAGGQRPARGSRAIASAAREPKLEIAVSRGSTPSSLRVRVEPSTAFPKATGADVFLAIVEDDLQSQVSRGENSGRRLSHTAVVRRLQVVGVLPAGKAFEKEILVAPDPSWKP